MNLCAPSVVLTYTTKHGPREGLKSVTPGKKLHPLLSSAVPSAVFPPLGTSSQVQSMLKTFENKTVTAREMHRI